MGAIGLNDDIKPFKERIRLQAEYSCLIRMENEKKVDIENAMHSFCVCINRMQPAHVYATHRQFWLKNERTSN